MLRMGMIGGAAALSPARRLLAQTSTTNGVGISAFATQPFLEALPIMPTKVAKATGPGCENMLTPGTMAGPLKAHVPYEGEKVTCKDALGAPYAVTYHQRYAQFAPQNAYEIHMKETKQKFHPAIPATTIWGFDGIFPGPTFKARYTKPGVPTANMVRFYNELPANHVGFGIPSTTIHLHNAHTPPESDGGPWNFFDSGTCWDNHYPNVLAGFSTDPAGIGDPTETLGTSWYHDHRQDFTAQNVYAGLEGFYLLYDDLDCDDETNPAGLRLPSGKYDVPLMFNDKVFGSDGNLVYDFFSLDGLLGDKMCVNGKVQPYMNVERRKYRFRMLNGGPSRVYAFGLSDGSAMYQISSDGNLLPMPVVRGVPGALPDLNDYIVTGVAERNDIIIDFSKYGPTQRIYLMNMAEQINGAGPTGKIAKTPVQLIQFRVGNLPLIADQSVIPNATSLAAIGRTTMRDLPDTGDLTTVAQNRTWKFERVNGGWAINGLPFDANRVSASVQRNSREVWTLQGGSGWWHPVHIHFEEHQVLSRNGGPGLQYEGRKDVVLLRGGETAKIYFNFRDWVGKYPMHCHNVVHEDHAMMVRWDMVDPAAWPSV